MNTEAFRRSGLVIRPCESRIDEGIATPVRALPRILAVVTDRRVVQWPTSVASLISSDQRTNASAVWVAVVAFAGIDIAGAVFEGTRAGPSDIPVLAYLLFLALTLNLVAVRLASGYLTMGGIATGTAALTLSPRFGVVVGLVGGAIGAVAISRAPTLVRVAQVLGAGAWTVIAAWFDVLLRESAAPRAVTLTLVAICFVLANWTVTSSIGALVSRQLPWAILSRNLNPHWIGAFIYIAVTSIVLATVLDGSITGFLVATMVALLSMALADSVAGREVRTRLQAQLDDTDRHLLHSRVVEGTIHDVRNFLAMALGHLGEPELESDKSARLAAEAVGDAIEALNRLQMGSSPKLRWSESPVDLSAMAADVISLVGPKSAQKRVRLTNNQPRMPPAVRGDPLLLRQVVTNLVLNAIEAVATGGHVTVRTGNRGDRAMLQVIDDGPGIPDKYRDRLFEPHFTTKPSGSGIGLFVSYGIVREHRGELLYEGNKNGAIFTVLLPTA